MESGSMTSRISLRVDCYKKQFKNSEKKNNLSNTDETHSSLPRILIR
jgi:hypothetical protein